MKDALLDVSLAFRRNFADLPFDADKSEETARRVNERVMTALSRAGESYAYIKPESLREDKRASLAQNRLLCEDTPDCPYNALFLQTGEGTSVQTALFDHMLIMTRSADCDMTACYARASAVAEKLESAGKIARHREYGFLTSRLSDAGTGLRAAYLLHLPMMGLVKQLPVISQLVSKAGLLLRPESGDVAQPAGALYLLENRVTLGRDEEQLLALLRAQAERITLLEAQLRQKARERGDEMVFDNPMRAYGVARYARKLTCRETLNLWSSITLAASLGVLSVTEQQLDKLYSAARGEQAAFAQNETGQHPDIARAAFVRGIFSEGKA